MPATNFISKSRFAWNIFWRSLLAFLTLGLAAFSVVNHWYVLLILTVPLLVAQFVAYYRFHKKAQEEVQQFVESVHYRDFSRYFDVRRAPAELQPFREGFNEINATFKIISKEKETQYLHLKTILEIVDTGILSYETQTGSILWMNESLKAMLQIPYLKTIYSLQKRNPGLYDAVIQLEAGKNVVVTLTQHQGSNRVLVSATKFISDGKTYMLIAFQNINEALDESEARAWQKLLSVMTHEIMNSVAPISSLAETIKGRIQESQQNAAKMKDALGDIETGIATIQKRSEGLLKFTETYRNLSRINKANISSVKLLDLLEHVQQLMLPTFEKKSINLEMELRDPGMLLEADGAMLEQVLINLLLNAADAVKDSPQPRITVLAIHDANNRPVIKVSDNGCGMSPEVMDKIFVPFFSTKKTGSGIGLSLCKQVMLLHKGSIRVQSAPGEGTVFTLRFN